MYLFFQTTFNSEFQSRDIIEKLKSDKFRTDEESTILNEKLIKSEMRQQEQQNTIASLFQQIQTGKSEIEHTQLHQRSSESKLINAQTQRLVELNNLTQENSNLKSEKDHQTLEITHLKRRISELEYEVRVDDSFRNYSR